MPPVLQVHCWHPNPTWALCKAILRTRSLHQAVPKCTGLECAQIVPDSIFLVLQVAEKQVIAAGALRVWGRHSCSSCRIKVSVYKSRADLSVSSLGMWSVQWCCVLRGFSLQALYISMLSLLVKGDVLGCAVWEFVWCLAEGGALPGSLQQWVGVCALMNLPDALQHSLRND